MSPQEAQPLARETGPGPTAAVTRERILDVAEALFAESGFAGTSVREIATRAGVTPGSLYNHWSGKQALYAAVIERGVHPLLELMVELAERDTRPNPAPEAVTAVMEHLSARPHLARLITTEAMRGGDHLSSLVRDWVEPIVTRGLATLERETGSPFTRDEFPSVIAVWIQIFLGHFALAPLLDAVLPEPPLSRQGSERHTRFLRKLAQMMTQAGPLDDPEPNPKTRAEE